MSAKRIKVDGDIAISEEALEKIRKDAVDDYKKVHILKVEFQIIKLYFGVHIKVLQVPK